MWRSQKIDWENRIEWGYTGKNMGIRTFVHCYQFWPSCCFLLIATRRHSSMKSQDHFCSWIAETCTCLDKSAHTYLSIYIYIHIIYENKYTYNICNYCIYIIYTMYVYIPSKKGVRESPCAAEEKVCLNMESPGTLSLVCVDRSPQKSLQHSSIRIGSKRTPQKLHLPQKSTHVKGW